MQLTAITVSLTIALIGVVLFVRAIAQLFRFIRIGRPVPPRWRTNDPVVRTVTVVREFLGHTRMNRWGVVGVAHWFVAVGFFSLLLTIAHALGQLFKADWALPVVGGFLPWELVVETFGTMMMVGILTLIVIRVANLPSRAGRKSRFTGSKMGQAYFVEAVILTVGVSIILLRGLEGALHHVDGYEAAYFISYPLVLAFSELSTDTLHQVVYVVAMVKISTSFIWMTTISLNTNMGVAWHRFLGFPNIWFKRNADGDVALGALLPM
ncbi:Fe-S oxidoreductase, partial [Streptomyces sp. WZ.A104]